MSRVGRQALRLLVVAAFAAAWMVLFNSAPDQASTAASLVCAIAASVGIASFLRREADLERRESIARDANRRLVLAEPDPSVASLPDDPSPRRNSGGGAVPFRSARPRRAHRSPAPTPARSRGGGCGDRGRGRRDGRERRRPRGGMPGRLLRRVPSVRSRASGDVFRQGGLQSSGRRRASVRRRRRDCGDPVQQRRCAGGGDGGPSLGRDAGPPRRSLRGRCATTRPVFAWTGAGRSTFGCRSRTC